MIKRKLLITGGKGYLGGRLCEFLDKGSDYQITVTSRSSDQIIGLPSINVIKVDMDKDDLSKILKDTDIIIHLAALDASASAVHAEEAVKVNIGDTVKWLEAATKVAVNQFIYFSTVHVYGSSLKGEINELTLPSAEHPYAISHKCAEDYVLYYGKKAGFKGHVIRLSNAIGFPFGIMNQWHLLVPDLCKSAVTNKLITLRSNPQTKRDFITIVDVVRAIDFLIKNQLKYTTGIYNLSSGECKTILEIAELIQYHCQQELNHRPEIKLLSQNKASISYDYRISNAKFVNEGFLFEKDFGAEIVGLLNCFKNQDKYD
jgi:UDP-glucose 4-epimerase